jgi:2'-5' RNA ligase
VNRLFVAVWPPDSLLNRLRALERPERPGLRWTSTQQWHVTLRFLGGVDLAGEGLLEEVLAAVATEAAPVEVSAGPTPRSFGRGVWVLPVSGLEPLAQRVTEATRHVGQAPPDRPFRGHLTLARARRPAALQGLPATPASDRWMVSDMTLVRSDLLADGARYHVVSRWPLSGQPGLLPGNCVGPPPTIRPS